MARDFTICAFFNTTESASFGPCAYASVQSRVAEQAANRHKLAHKPISSSRLHVLSKSMYQRLHSFRINSEHGGVPTAYNTKAVEPIGMARWMFSLANPYAAPLIKNLQLPNLDTRVVNIVMHRQVLAGGD